jgi:predicted Zn-dependent protease
VGQELAAKAGWDPAAMAEFLGTLDQESVRQLGEPRLPTFLDSHPVTAERVHDTRTRANSLSVQPAAPIARDREAFLMRLEGLLIGPDPAEGVFEGALFLHPGIDFALEFPRGWATVNSKQAVGAQSPSQDAMIVLQGQGQAGDPRTAAQAFAQQNRLELVGGGAGRIGGYDAYQARALAQSQQGRLALDLTWIAHPGGVFRISGMTAESAFQNYEPAFSQTALSFRPLRRAERDGIQEQRLRIVRAKRGETLDSLGRRTENSWSAEQTAVANALSPGGPLTAGRLVKIAVEVPYRPR